MQDNSQSWKNLFSGYKKELDVADNIPIEVLFARDTGRTIIRKAQYKNGLCAYDGGLRIIDDKGQVWTLFRNGLQKIVRGGSGMPDSDLIL